MVYIAVVFALLVGIPAIAPEAYAQDKGANTIPGVQLETGFGAGWWHEKAGLQMYKYVPRGRTGKTPLVVMLHGCHAPAWATNLSRWPAFADRWKFAVLVPHKLNAFECWKHEQTKGDQQGVKEREAIRDMVKYAIDNYNVDKERVFVVGGSGGAGMAGNLLATYPEMFAAGSAHAGGPIDFTPVVNGRQAWGDQRDPQRGTSLFVLKNIGKYGAKALGDFVRDAKPEYKGVWPSLQIWHGAKDNIVTKDMFNALLAQWTNLHGLPSEKFETPITVSQVVDSAVYRDAREKPVVVAHTVQYAGHEMAGPIANSELEEIAFFGLNAKKGVDKTCYTAPNFVHREFGRAYFAHDSFRARGTDEKIGGFGSDFAETTLQELKPGVFTSVKSC